MKRKIKLRKCRVLLIMLLTTLITTCVSKIALAGTTNFVSTGAFEIHKTDSETGKGIKDTVYTVKNSLGELVGKIKTDDNGYEILEGLYAGNYTLTEESSNENYSGYYI